MANPVNDIRWRFLGDTKSLDAANKRASKGFKDANKQTGLFSKGLSSLKAVAGAVGVAFGTMQMVRWAGDAIQLAIAADEIDSKFKAVFGTTKEFTQALSAWGDVAGVTDADAKNLAATFGNLAMAQGISIDETKALTLDVATLAGDLASFNDSDPETVFFDLNKALLTTEREGMKKYGIAITEAEVKTRAAAIAAADGRSEVTKADRAYASYAIAVEQAGKANGDLERTSDSLANQQRQLKATVEELQTEIGHELVPAYRDLLGVVSDLTPVIGESTSALGTFISESTAFTSGLAQATDSTNSFGDRVKGATSSIWDIVDAGLRYNVVTGMFMVATDKLADSIRGEDDALTKLNPLMNTGIVLAGQYERSNREAAGGVDDLTASMGGAAAAGSRVVAAMREFIQLRTAMGGGTVKTGIVAPGNIQGFATGGVVPGPKGAPRIIKAHGGEIVTPPNGSDGGSSVVVNFNGVVGDPVAVAQQIQDLIQLADRTGG